jgi:cytochrome c oxidase subunit 2
VAVRVISRTTVRPPRLPVALAGIVLAGAALAGDDTTRTSSVFAPVSAPADAAYTVAMLVLSITAGILVVVGGLLAYSIVAFRRRPDDDGSEPAQVYGSDQIELAWTVIPILVVVVLCLVTARTVYDVQAAPKPPGAIDVTVVGHQWWWAIRYPDLGVVTANELHVPVSDPAHSAPTFLTLESADVIHSFWVPQLAGKMDVIPNKTNHVWIEPTRPGTYVGQCAEYCGIQHGLMLLVVVVHPKEEFERWVAAQRTPARDDAAAQHGRDLFASLACINCHTIRGTPANGVFGPDLTHLMSRWTIGAGAARNTRENLHTWVEDPATLKLGALMPAMKVSREELEALTSYLVTLQ